MRGLGGSSDLAKGKSIMDFKRIALFLVTNLAVVRVAMEAVKQREGRGYPQPTERITCAIPKVYRQ